MGLTKYSKKIKPVMHFMNMLWIFYAIFCINVSIKVKFKSLKSRIVYQIFFPRCQACYVGQTDRQLLKRFKEQKPSQPYGRHIRLCGASPNFENKDDVSVIHVTTRSISYLEALEALWVREIRPSINTKDE